MCNLLQYSKFNYFVFATCVLWVIIIKTIFNMPRYNTYSMMWKNPSDTGGILVAGNYPKDIIIANIQNHK